MKKITYQTRRVRSCFNRVIELNQKMLILKRFITKKWFFLVIFGEKLTLQVTNKDCHLKWRKLEYQTRRVRSCFNRVIKLNQKMLIFKRFVTKNDFYVMMTTEMFINYFCNIKLCCLWKFDGNMSVIYWEIICANILFYIYCFRVRHLYTWQHWMATKMWHRCYWRQGHHYPQWTKR